MYSESNDKSSPSNAEVYTELYAWRRQYLDEILFNNNIPTQVKLFAIDLSFSINRKSRASYEGYSRFAKRLHLKLRVVRDAAEWLRSDGRLKIEQRYGKQHLEPLTKGDARSDRPAAERTFMPLAVLSAKQSCDAISLRPPASFIAVLPH
jgi:hypothetical protein